MRRTLTVVGVAAMFAAAAGRADDGPVRLKIKKPGPGDAVKYTATERVTLRSVVKAPGAAQSKDEENRTQFAFTERVLTKPEGAATPTKLERTYDKAEVVINGADANLGLAGKTVLIEKKGDAFDFSTVGRPLAGKGRDLLAKEFRTDKSESLGERFLPETPVAVGATWKPDAAGFAKWIGQAVGLTFDPTKSICTAKLTKLYKKDGRLFAVTVVDATLFATKLDSGGAELTLNEGSKLVIRVELDNCVDGSAVAGRSKITSNGKLAARLDTGTLSIAMTDVMVSTADELPKTPAP